MVSIVNRLFVSCLLSHDLVQCMIVLWILCQFLEFIQFLIQDFIVFNVFVSTEIGKLCFLLFVLHITFYLGNRQNKSFVCTVLLLTLLSTLTITKPQTQRFPASYGFSRSVICVFSFATPLYHIQRHLYVTSLIGILFYQFH